MRAYNLLDYRAVEWLSSSRGGKMRAFLFVFISVILSGCISSVESNFTPYHVLTPDDAGKAVLVIPGMEELKGSLQFSAFKAKLENKFQEAGYSVTDDVAATDYIALFSYAIDDGTTTTHSGSSPIYGQTGGGTTYHSGSVSSYGTGGYGTGSYSGTSYTAPTYGVVGSVPYSYDTTTYSRGVRLEMIDRRAFDARQIKTVFEANLSSKGRCGQIAVVMDALLEALFQNFPGESGKARSISVPYNGDGC